MYNESNEVCFTEIKCKSDVFHSICFFHLCFAAFFMADPRILFMTNLTPKLAVAEKLFELCGEFGAVRQIRLGNNPETRLSAIVVYELCESAELALKTLHDKQISKTRFLHVTVYDEAREKKMLEKRKRLRGRENEYREHIHQPAV